MSNAATNVAVIGAGIIGSWTALHLIEAGINTTLFEQYPLPHTRGSSHGASRAFRLLGDERLAPLDYSLERWRALQNARNETLFVQTGLLNFGPPGDPYLDRYMAILERGGRSCAWLDSATIRARFPGLRYPAAWGAAWDPLGGILYANRCLNAVQRQFLARGGQLITARVESVNPHAAAGVTVRLQHQATDTIATGHFDKVVVCAGPWTAGLLPQLSKWLHCLRIPVTYWRDPSGRCSVSQGFPILFNARLTGVYALPACEYPGLVKVLSHSGPVTDPEARDEADFTGYIARVSAYVRDHLPLLEHAQPAILESCMYTMTPDSQPIVARLSDDLTVGCGFSGSGFKHSPATGSMLAALALGREHSLPSGFETQRYALERF